MITPIMVVVAAMLLVAGNSAAAKSPMDMNSNVTTLALNNQGNASGVSAPVLLPEVNPHWDKQKCDVCHLSTPQKGKPDLRNSDVMVMCLECHEDDVVHKYIHPAGVKVPKSFAARMKKNWKKGIRLNQKNQLTCSTCHDMLNQCLPKRSYMSRLNPRFLREGPYRSRTEVCYKCHDDTKYKKLVAHDQISDDNTLKLNKCRLCHQVKARGRVKRGIKRDQSDYPFINNLDNDRKLLCIRCHKKVDHPTSAFRVASINSYRHLVRITGDKKRTLDKMKAETGMFMPLETDTGRIYCGTCHEAHQPGVFAGEAKRPVPKTQKRLRADRICTYCHDK